MAEVQWIKLTTNMFDDEKIRLIQAMPESDAIIVIWVRLLTLAGKTNDSGQIYMAESMPYSDEMLATLFNKPVNTIRLAINTLESFGMVEVLKDGVIFVNNWEKHQNVDGLEKIKIDNNNRQKKFMLRNKLKKLGINPDSKMVPNEDLDKLEEFVEKVSQETNVSLTLPNALEEKREEEKRKEEEKKTSLHDDNNSSRNQSAAFFYENNGFGTIAPHIKDQMNGIYDDFMQIGATESDINQLIIKALSLSVEQNVRRWAYAERILINWCNSGYKSVSDVEANETRKNPDTNMKNQKGGSAYERYDI